MIYNTIPFSEIESWASQSGYDPTAWEIAKLRMMDAAYVNAKSSASNKSNGLQHQAIGGYCNGEEVETCRKTFGEQLDRVCATCPN